jgi:hypothetical protein
MRRNLILPIAGGVVAALVLVGALLLIGHRHKTAELTIESPPPSASVSPSPAATPSPTATASASPSGSPAASASPKAKPTPTPHPVRAVSSVNCNDTSDQQFCSRKDGVIVQNGKGTEGPANPSPTPGPDEATIAMRSSYSNGDIHVVVTITNKTSKTFHFPAREIEWDATRNKQHFATLTTHGAGFDMPPGAKMTGTFDQHVTEDGIYVWQAKTWYYTK